MTSATLWAQHLVVNSPRDLAFIEAELGRRGETNHGIDYLGRRTAEALGKPTYRRMANAAGDRNCGDFETSAEAQHYFLSNGGPASDPNGLDRDGDGLACEWGTQLRSIASRYASTYRAPIPTRSFGGACHVGPRGGTYTITASGGKNYGGC
ncbi:excalibur calcium-binding domain-containing protein [Phaeovulum sp.]|uniref:excalibur calcium-binding domain-containing protein n=1 Tax=Phaeovulum sp. TaxID=2934796 RepID=UPI002AB97E6F|nr:excalibur calcium-binding domain-containing protein [Phaeovulum sp.]MDZ4118745.1 excalibur calcium-binding domain-containing protein [Phaeovulum sp.]